MIIIGDVHGCYKTLMELINQFPKDEKFCFVGDLIDRGFDSKLVLDYVLDNYIDCVRGNHEDMMLYNRDMWVCNGGLKTINSIGSDLVKHYKASIELNFPYYKNYVDIKNSNGRNLFVAHSGLFGPNIDLCVKDGIITWYRGYIYDKKDLFQVFGHTPVKEPIITEYYANIDTGCCFKEYGILTALQFPEMKIFQQKNIEEFF